MTKKTTEQATTRIAKRMAKEAGQPEGMWELFLMDAYREYHGFGVHPPGGAPKCDPRAGMFAPRPTDD